MKKARIVIILIGLVSIAGLASLLIVNYGTELEVKPIYIYLNIGLSSFCLGMLFMSLFYNSTLRRFEFYKKRVDLWNKMTYRVKGAGETAFNNLPIGIILFNDKGIVEWANDFARKIFQNKLTDYDIANIDKNLAKNIFEKKNQFTCTIYGKTYECNIIEGANILYLNDVTEKAKMAKRYEEHIPAIGVLHVDNLVDTLNGLDANERAETSNKLVQLVSEWEERYDIFVSPSSTERYVVLCNKEALERMQKDNFFIVDAIREHFSSKMMHITASLGFACFDSPQKDIASKALDELQLALDRGGDQIVVNINGNVSYYGARTLSSENRTAVQVRIKAKEFADLVSKYNRVVVMGHQASDTDSFGSSIALFKIAQALGKEAYIIYDEDSADQTVVSIMRTIKKDYIGLLDNFVSPKEAINLLTNDTLLVITDCQFSPIVLEEKIYKAAKHVAVLDHHRRNAKSINNYEYMYVHTSASSAVELVVEMYEFLPEEVLLKLDVSEIEATWMLMGIIVDTNNFVYRTSAATFRVLAKLEEFGASTAVANRLLRDEYPKFIKRAAAINTMEIYKSHYAIATIPDSEVIDRQFVAKVADDLILVDGVKMGFCIGRLDKETVAISARSLDEANSQVLMERMGGGGHFNSAAAQFKGQSVEEVKSHLEDMISEFCEGEKENMRVILVKEVRGKGKVNDIIEVPAGYGNYLLRSNQAISATPENIKMVENKINAKALELEKEVEDAKKLRDKINDSEVTIKARVGEQGKLYGSVTSRLIVDEIMAQLGVEIDKRKVMLDKEITALGTYKIAIHLHKDVTATLTIYVVERD